MRLKDFCKTTGVANYSFHKRNLVKRDNNIFKYVNESPPINSQEPNKDKG